ncbi:MAG TPA: polysaccharide biosynthesis/export family protein [Blastocatellia bacterium]|nr:polysaccharide biosynthesis/export family protein [Blastocatellia bacterium]
MKTMTNWLSYIRRRRIVTACVSFSLCAGGLMTLAPGARMASLTSVAILQESQPQQKEAAGDKSAETSRPSERVVSGIHLPTDEEYRIGVNDVIDIQIDHAPELSGTFRVSASGTFFMHYLGRVKAIDKTVEELTQTIADGLRGKYLKDPSVRIVVLQYNSRSYFIQGAVNKPGVYQIDGRPTLLELFTIAGGLAANHGSTAFIIRKIEPEREADDAEDEEDDDEEGEPKRAKSEEPAEEESAKYELLKSNISGLLKGNFNNNVPIEPGDIVNVPPTDVFFVSGEVKNPGQFPLKDGTTLRQAISLAQGLTFTAAGSRGVIFRENPATGERIEIKVDVSEIMKGKKSDIPILANDVLIIPNSRLKSVGRTLLSGFGFGMIRFPGLPRVY